MTQTTIDLATFEALKEAAGSDFVLELVDTFLSEAPLMLGDLRSALAANDADRFRRAAHSLKSNSLTFGASMLGAMAKALELGGIGPARETGGEPLDRLDDEYARVTQALSELRNA